MNTPVSFSIAKLLKEKGLDIEKQNFYNSHGQLNSDIEDFFIPRYEAPTIVEVVVWLYEKHGILTVVNVNIMGSWYFEHFDLKEKRNAQFKPTDTHYDSPTEAYEAAIIYTLKNLI